MTRAVAQASRAALAWAAAATCLTMLLAQPGWAQPPRIPTTRAAARAPYGNLLLRSAPVIEQVTVEPQQPGAGVPVVVRARISHQPFSEPAQVAAALLRVSTDAGSTWQEFPMTQVSPAPADPKTPGEWEVGVGGWPAGTGVVMCVTATSTLGSAAVQLEAAPAPWPPTPERLTLVMGDPDDLDIMAPDDSDILECRCGWDGENVIVGMRVQGSFDHYVLSQVQTGFAAAAFLDPDREANLSPTEGRMLAFLPVLPEMPIPRFGVFDGGRLQPVADAGADGKVAGEWLWLRCRRAALRPGPSGRLVVAFATLSVNDISSPQIEPKDGTNCVMLQFGGQSITVR